MDKYSLVYIDGVLIIKPSCSVTFENKIEVKDNLFTKYVRKEVRRMIVPKHKVCDFCG